MNRLHARLREAGEAESGFTLIELLVVMLVIANLAAIALPMFINQKGKASDAKAKLVAHNAQVAMETCSTAHPTGAYTNCNTNAALRAIDASLPSVGVDPTVTANSYTIKVTAVGGNTFSVVRSSTGTLSFPCTVSSAKRGGCPGSGTAEGTWG